MRPILPVLAVLLLGAAPSARLHPGLWEIRNDPDAATLDGKVLHDLPLDAIRPQQVCMTPAEAADPATWLARDSAADCTLTKRRLGGGKVDIAGSCPAQEEGKPAGSLRLGGTWAPERFAMRFRTTSFGSNGTMGFSGTMVGRRIGDCPGG